MAVVPLALVSERLAAVGRMAGPRRRRRAGVVGRSRPVRARSHLARRRLRRGAWWSRTTRRWWCAGRSGGGDPTVSGSAEPSGAARLRRSALAVASAAAVWILVQPLALLAGRGDGRLHVTFLDVGQGDSALVRFPRGATMLVDAGGLAGSSRFDIGDRVVAPVLRDARHSTARLRRADARRSGPHRRSSGDRARVPSARGVGGHSRAAIRTAHGAAAFRRRRQGRGWANVYRGDRLLVDGVDDRGAASGAGRLGAAEGAERRLDRARPALAGRLGAADGRHRQGSRAHARRRGSGRAAPGAEGSASRQPDVEQPGIPAGCPAADRRLQRRPGQPFRTSRAGGAASATATVGAAIFRTDQDGAVMLDTDGYSIDVHTFTGRTLSQVTTTTKPRRHEGHEGFMNAPSTLNTSRLISKSLVTRVIGCCIAVHRELGPGLLESIYSRAIALELEQRGIPYSNARRRFRVEYRDELLCHPAARPR